jgi:hypothetical protein
MASRRPVPAPGPPELVGLDELLDATAVPDRQGRRYRPQHRQPVRGPLVRLSGWIRGGWARTRRAGALTALAIGVAGAGVSILIGTCGGVLVVGAFALLRTVPSARQVAEG